MAVTKASNIMDALATRAGNEYKELTLLPNNRYEHVFYFTRISLYQDQYVDQTNRIIQLFEIPWPIGAPDDGCLKRMDPWASLPQPSKDAGNLVGTFRLVILALFDEFRIGPYIKHLVARPVEGRGAETSAEAAFRLAADLKQVAEFTASGGFAVMRIAIMTMLFLPATFFAALVAMPTIGWDTESNGVMMLQMWLYVELALPVTVGIS